MTVFKEYGFVALLLAVIFVCNCFPIAALGAILEEDPYNWDVPALTEQQNAVRKARLQLDVDEEYDLNILLIGCSFGADTMSQTPAVLKALYPDLKFNIGRIFRGSTPIKDHYAYSRSEEAVYAYIEHYYNGSGNVATSTLFSSATSPRYLCNMQLAIDRADWDIVILQTTSGYCAIDGSYATDEINYVTALREYVQNRLKTNNPDSDPEFFWNMVWTLPSFSTNSKFVEFDKNTLKMYDGIIRNVKSHVVEADTGIDYVIPNGTAVINAVGNGIDDKFMYRDNEHLSTGDTMKQYLGASYTGDGYFTAGLTTAATLALNSNVIRTISGNSDYTITSDSDRNAKIDSVVDTAMANTTANLYSEHQPLIVDAVKEAIKYPFVTVANADSLIQAANYDFKTSELEGKTENDVKALLADKINATANVTYTGFSVAASDITITGYSAETAAGGLAQDFAFTVAYPNATVSKQIEVSSSSARDLTVKAGFDNGALLPVTSDLSFTFNQPVPKELAVPANIVLKEEIKGTSLYNTRSYDDYEYDAATSTYTIHFGEGDLAANTAYAVTFSTDIATGEGVALYAEKTFTFTTVSEGWYINDNFSRYTPGTSLAVNNTNVTDLLPLQYAFRANNSAYASGITTGADGRNAFKVSSYSTSTAAVAFSAAGYRMDYMPDETYTKIKSCEVEFDFYGDDSAVYGVYTSLLTIAQLADGKFYLCGRKDGFGTIIDDTTKNNYYKNNLTPICEIAEFDEQSPSTHTLSFKMYSDYMTSSSYQRRLYDMYLDGKKITQVVDANGVTATGAQYTDFPENGVKLSAYIDGAGNAANMDMNYCATEDSMRGRKMFISWVDTTASGEDKKEANLRIYSVKYGECPSVTSNVKNDQLGVPCDSEITLSFAAPLLSTNDYSLINVTATENDADVAYEYTRIDDRTIKLTFDKNVYMDYRIDVPSFKTSDKLPLDAFSVSFKTESLGFEHTDNGSAYDGGGNVSVSKIFNVYDRAAASGIDCKLIFAVYADGKLVYSKISDAVTDAATDTATINIQETISDPGFTADSEIAYRAFLVESTENIKPLTISKRGNIN